MIDELKKLSPAEIMLIENPKIKVDQLARVTFMDLLLKDVLQIDEVPKGKGKKARANPFVSKGKAFDTYEPLKHESVFLNLFKHDSDIKVTLKNLIKVSFKDIKSAEVYKLKHVYTKRLDPYFTSNIIQWLAGARKISRHGLATQKLIKKELVRIKNKVKRNDKDLIETLMGINGNVFLLNGVYNKVFKTLSDHGVRNLKTDLDGTPRHWQNSFLAAYAENYDMGNSFDIGVATSHTFTSTLDSIDSWQGTSDSSSSGCGGSGCSGVGCGSSGCSGI